MKGFGDQKSEPPHSMNCEVGSLCGGGSECGSDAIPSLEGLHVGISCGLDA